MFRRPRRGAVGSPPSERVGGGGGDSSSLVVVDDDARPDIESAVGPSPPKTTRGATTSSSSSSRSSRDGGDDGGDSEERRTRKEPKKRTKKNAKTKRTRRSTGAAFPTRFSASALLLVALALLLVVVAAFVVFVPRYALHLILLIPIVAAASAAVAVDPRKDRGAASRAVAGAFVSSILSQRLPSWLTGFVAAFGLGLFGLGTRRRPPPPPDDDDATSNGPDDRDEERRRRRNGEAAIGRERKIYAEKIKTVCTALLMIFNLLVENFFTWVVAATYYPSHHDTPTPLQDNGRTALIYVFETTLQLTRDDVQRLRSGLNVPFALVAGLSASLACCELKLSKKRTLWGVARRAMLTLATARFVRTVSFLSTVLPSQVPRCYERHFPPPPPDWYTWMKIGLLPNTEGGCNDLIVSGHATVTSVAAAVSASVSDSVILGVAMGSLLAFDYAAEVYQGYHYTVDMWMGGVLTAMIWKIYSFVEEEEEEDDVDEDGDDAKGRTASEEEFLPLRETTLNDVAFYFAPCLASYWVTIFAPGLVNPFVVTTCVFVVIMAIRNGITQYVQHVLLCLLYAALGTYL